MLENSRAGLTAQINPDRNYRPDEVAAIFRCDKSTVYRWIERGHLECIEGPSGYLKRIPGKAIREMVEIMPVS